MSAPNWAQPGLFTSAQDVAGIQRTTARWAASEGDPAQANADQREIRYRMLVKSAVLWAVIGLPLLITLFGTLVWWAISHMSAGASYP